MTISVASLGEIIWVVGLVAWYVIRYPFERRAKRVRIVAGGRSSSDTVGLA
ncbi:MAG: isoprenylcysteine carboxylmethyltransferase family protein, partial [Mesorhizobium sp.]